MQDTELYQHLIGLKAPWSVEKVELKAEQHEVHVWLKHPEKTRFPCPHCQQDEAVYDHTKERTWRHLDSCHFTTLVHARIPRVGCSEHGTVQVEVPWAGPLSRFTLLFEILAIDVLQACDVSATGEILSMTWEEAWGVLERATARGLKRKEARPYHYLGVDEKAIAKRHKYFTLVCDLNGGTVEYVTEDRTQSSLDAFYKSLAPQQLESIQGIAMDMWEPYIKSTKANVPSGDKKIVFDRFHVMQHMGRAVDKVRRQEHKQLTEFGDPILSGTKYLWLTSQENLDEKQRPRFEALRSINLKTGRAWAIKESLRTLWSQPDRNEAQTFWKRWYWWGTHSRLDPVRQVAKTVKNHLDNILTYYEHHITNAVCEGLNSKIQTIKQMAKGFRNKENFKAAIYFRCGGLSLYPTHTIAG